MILPPSITAGKSARRFSALPWWIVDPLGPKAGEAGSRATGKVCSTCPSTDVMPILAAKRRAIAEKLASAAAGTTDARTYQIDFSGG